MEVHPGFSAYNSELLTIVQNFETSGEVFGNQKRNTLKLFHLDNHLINVKSFKIPNLVNRLAYRFLRKGKARRSYEYANRLLELGINTPAPIAYCEQGSKWLFGNSYYFSSHLDYDLTYRELIHNFDYPDYNNILRAFTRFTHQLHEKGVLFLDHSPGNTLIRKDDGDYAFYLVDLNRMQFKTLTHEERFKNFSRLTEHRHMVQIMSDEYAKCMGMDASVAFEKMWHYTQKFRSKFDRKKALKKRLGL